MPGLLSSLTTLVLVTLSQPVASICSSEQCNPARTGIIVGSQLPDSHPLTLQWHLPLSTGGPGDCSTDGSRIVCTSRGQNFSAFEVSPEGKPKWMQQFSGASPNGTTPVMQGGLIEASWALGGSVFAAFDSGDGTIGWEQGVADPEGLATFSAGLTSNAYLMVRLGSGSLAVYDAVQGNCWASVQLGQTEPGSKEYYAPTATAAIIANRGYIATAHTTDPNRPDRLYVADVLERAIGRIDVVSYVDIHSIAGQYGVVALEQASGALVLAYGQLAAASQTHLIAIRDDGMNATVAWTTPLAASAMGVVADPRGGVWVYNQSAESLVHLSERDGTALGAWKVSSLGQPASRAVVASSDKSGHPVLIASWQRGNHAEVAALDLVTGTVRWTYKGMGVGQFVIAHDLLVFASKDGITALG